MIASLKRTMDSAWFGIDVTARAQAPAILNAEYLTAVNAAGTGVVNMIGVDSSNNVVFPNPIVLTGDITTTKSVSTAAPAAERLVKSEITLSYAGSVNIAASASIAAVRGNSTIASGTTLAGGFLYGTQGKVTIVGALTTANYVAGLIGQLDTSAAGSLGTTPLCAIWGDMGATSTAATDTGADILKLTNTTACAINSAILVNAKASFFADLTDITGAWSTGTTASTAAGVLKVKLGGVTKYLQLYSGAS